MFLKDQCSSHSRAELDAAFLGAVTTNQESSWTISLLLGNREVPFKLDTGAEVTAITKEAYKNLGDVKLQSPTKALYGPSCQSLKVLGQFTRMLTHQQHSSSQTIFVVCGLKTNLLGLPAITSLQLLHRVNATHS